MFRLFQRERKPIGGPVRDRIVYLTALAIHSEMTKQGTAFLSSPSKIPRGEKTIIDGDIDLLKIAEVAHDLVVKHYSTKR